MSSTLDLTVTWIIIRVNLLFNLFSIGIFPEELTQRNEVYWVTHLSSALSAVPLFLLNPDCNGPRGRCCSDRTHDKHVSDQVRGWCVTRKIVFSPWVYPEEPVCAQLIREPGNHLLSYTYSTVQFFSGRRAVGRSDRWSPCSFQVIGIKKIPWFSFGVSGGVLSYWPDRLLVHNWSVLCDRDEGPIAILRWFTWSGALAIRVRAGFCFVWKQKVSLMNLYEATVKTIIFHIPVFLSDVLTHDTENTDLSLHCLGFGGALPLFDLLNFLLKVLLSPAVQFPKPTSFFFCSCWETTLLCIEIFT